MSRRLLDGGRIDRSKGLSFTLDGKRYSGFAGDTLASALLANDVTLIGRSFKYHRPRGFVSCGPEEPNGLFTLGEDGRQEPNVPGTTTVLTDSLKARTQNNWPSVNFDLMAASQLAGPLLAAGFYYKTFMGPRAGSWMFYEPFIRRAAGLGIASRQADPDRYEHRHAYCDVLVVGSGPAGLAAALTAGRAGARVILAEQDMGLGGSLLSESDPAIDNWRDRIVFELASLPKVECLTHTTALGLYDGSMVALVQRHDHLRPNPANGLPRQTVISLQAKTIVFATGAIERPFVFPGNDRPGVMLAASARRYLNCYGVLPGERAVVVTNNDSAYAAAFDLAAAGASVTIADLRNTIDIGLLAKAAAACIALLPGCGVAGVESRDDCYRVHVAGLETATRAAIDCDLVLMSGGWSPTVHLTSHTGIKPRFDETLGAFVPGGLASGHFAAGAVLGHLGLAAAIADGLAAAQGALLQAGLKPKGKEIAKPGVEERPSGMTPLWRMPKGRSGKAFVDFQNDVTDKDLKIAHQEGYRSVEHLKRYTTLGMGTDQGKTSNLNAIAMMAGLRDVPMSAAGTTTFRPPFTPVAIGALAGRNVGAHFRPHRLSPLHDWHAANGATFIEAGPWMRAWYYAWAGTSPETAYVNEMKLVRQAVGLADVSTLGKIDVQGPDAAEFLNRVYVNGFAKLPVGKARYGVMLNDDGVVLDDGTTTRLSETRYFMTTTTAQAGEVMSWLEFLLQTAWTDLCVQVSSLTDQWAGMAVSGPKAREALQLAFPGEALGNAQLAYMACKEFAFEGAPVRLIRLSFSGELAYEVYTPAGFGVALWEHLLKAAASLGIKPYGLEALASLRVEKGHVAGLELDHRNTLDDLGLGRMASKDKAYIGRELRQRPNLQVPERWSLVGLELLEPEKRLRGGAILFATADEIKGHGRGYITSVTWSIELGKFIALGLYQGGLAHENEEIVCAYPLKDEVVRARIVSPLFIDPKGERLHA